MSTNPIRIGTRGSQLALWQANHIADELRSKGHTVAVEVIRTTGDRMQDPFFTAPATFDDGTPLDAKGIFIKEIEDALLDGRIDVAVHSLKDLPTTLDPRFRLAAIPARADARDAFVCEQFWGLHMLPMGALVATTSPRRQAMLLALAAGSGVHSDARQHRHTAAQVGGRRSGCACACRRGARSSAAHGARASALLGGRTLSCARAGCARAGGAQRTQRHCVAGRHRGARERRDPAVEALNDAEAAFATSAERAVLGALGGGCNLPLGAFCHAVDGQWHLHAMAVAPDGDGVAHVLHKAAKGISPIEFGNAAAEVLKQRGALDLLAGDVDTVLGARALE